MPTMVKEKVPTKGMLLLEAARQFERPFTWAELVIRAWLTFPQEFGLPGYEHYPDSHRVSSTLYGAGGLFGTGQLCKTDDGRFEVVECTPS